MISFRVNSILPAKIGLFVQKQMENEFAFCLQPIRGKGLQQKRGLRFVENLAFFLCSFVENRKDIVI